MASPQRAPGSQPFDQSLLDELVDTESGSGSSYVGSDESVARPSICRFRTTTFHDRECARYFDCPSHIVERRLSVDDSAEDEATHRSDDEDDIRNHPPSNHQSLDAQENPDLYTSSPRPESTEDQEEPQLPGTTDHTEPSPDTENRVTTTDTTSRPEARPEGRQPDLSQDEVGSGSHDRRTNDGAGLQVATPTELGRPATDTRLEDQNQTDPAARPQFRYLPVSREITEDLFQTPGNDNAERGLPPPPRPQYLEGGRRTSDIQLPRWQPDAEVTLCPICHTQFSFFVRKHHCRKCGRVVCNSCSPHRIIIPHQYIVRAPGSEAAAPQTLLVDSLGAGYFDTHNMSGGERVRLCNPCVPDPNTAPPQSPAGTSSSSSQTPRPGARTNLRDGRDSVPSSNRHGAIFAPGPANEYRYLTSRSRSITMGHAAPGSSQASSTGRRRRSGILQSPAERLLSAFPLASPSSSYPSRQSSLSNLASSSRQRALPPTPQIAEEDECPICHRELPPVSLANSENLRELHITRCIESHSTYGTPRAEEGGGEEPPAAPRRTGMYTYPATEKDCIDDAECTICLEEFTVGVPMARLECLCRFHRSCISAWFVNHPGRCPVHQHDGFGY